MSWSELHQKSERLAAEAQALTRQEPDRAQVLYAEAAQMEAEALASLAPAKVRTMGITAVSAVALWLKAKRFEEAQKLAYQVLGYGATLPSFAVDQLRGLLQSIWSEQVRQSAGFRFTEGALLVSVSGGQSVTGGAPLDLIVSKVEGIQSLFFRTVEYLQKLPHRKRGPAPADVQSICRPWLFQAVPGSFQFAVAIEEVAQRSLFGPEVPSVEEIKGTFVALLRDTAEDPEMALAERVPDREYRATFLKLMRALAPTGKDFSVMTVKRNPTDPDPITLDSGSRKTIGEVIRREFTKPREQGEKEGSLAGKLRAVHLDQDWLEVTVEGEHIRVYGVGETVDDIIGPLMNRDVVVHINTQTNGRIVFRDIEGAA
jgi:hypothetical protein